MNQNLSPQQAAVNMQHLSGAMWVSNKMVAKEVAIMPSGDNGWTVSAVLQGSGTGRTTGFTGDDAAKNAFDYAMKTYEVR